ncbi:MAG: hypothetical protein AB8B83_04550 [Bdellovibrionales bacterium]
MSPDKEIVLRNFGQASETNFMLHYVLQLFLSIEQNRTHDPYNIEQESVLDLFKNDARIPRNIRTFILWEANIIQRDHGEILNIEMPRGLTKKYDVKGARLEADKDVNTRISAIQACLEEVEHYFIRFNEVRAILEATEDRFKTVEERLLRAESMDGSLAGVLAEQKKVVEEIRITLTNLNADLEDDALPDLIKFEKTPERAMSLMVTLSEANLYIRDAIRRYNVGDD